MERILLVNGSHGIYCPQVAVERLSSYKPIPMTELGGIEFEKEFLTQTQLLMERIKQGPTNEDYWEDWMEICDNCHFVDSTNGVHYIIEHDDDVWLINVDSPLKTWYVAMLSYTGGTVILFHVTVYSYVELEDVVQEYCEKEGIKFSDVHYLTSEKPFEISESVNFNRTED